MCTNYLKFVLTSFKLVMCLKSPDEAIDRAKNVKKEKNKNRKEENKKKKEEVSKEARMIVDEEI